MNSKDRIGQAIDAAVEDIVTNGYRWNNEQVADHLEYIGKLVARQPRRPKPPTAVNRSALNRLEQLRSKS